MSDGGMSTRRTAGLELAGRNAARGDASGGGTVGGVATGRDAGHCEGAGRVTTLAAAPPASPVRSLTRDFLAWIAGGPRSYAEVMEAWRTSCPRLSIWEDALADGLVRTERAEGATGPVVVSITGRGRAVLDGRG